MQRWLRAFGWVRQRLQLRLLLWLELRAAVQQLVQSLVGGLRELVELRALFVFVLVRLWMAAVVEPLERMRAMSVSRVDALLHLRTVFRAADLHAGLYAGLHPGRLPNSTAVASES